MCLCDVSYGDTLPHVPCIIANLRLEDAHDTGVCGHPESQGTGVRQDL